MNIPNEIHTYLTSLLNEAGLSYLGEEAKEAAIQKLFVELDEFLIERVVSYLPEERLPEFTVFMQQKPSREQLESYLKVAIPDIGAVFASGFSEFREVYTNAAQGIQHTSKK